VTLRLSLASAEEASTTQVRFRSDEQSYGTWEQFASERIWTLPEGEGPVSIFAQPVLVWLPLIVR
jgi:hypothetical protein